MVRVESKAPGIIWMSESQEKIDQHLLAAV